MTLEERFWAKVDRRGPGECWLWTAGIDDAGYGRFKAGSRNTDAPVKAHRFAYELQVGPILPGLFVCHHCDDPRCVNPDHLYLAPHAENMRDMAWKGRAHRTIGELSGRAKLTWEIVRDIRRRHADGESMSSLATRFGVTKSSVSYICNGRTWQEPTSA